MLNHRFRITSIVQLYILWTTGMVIHSIIFFARAIADCDVLVGIWLGFVTALMCAVNAVLIFTNGNIPVGIYSSDEVVRLWWRSRLYVVLALLAALCIGIGLLWVYPVGTILFRILVYAVVELAALLVVGTVLFAVGLVLPVVARQYKGGRPILQNGRV